MRMVLLAGLVLCLGSTACVAVKPWERETLARSDMAWSPDAMDATHRDHVFFAKEGALRAGHGSGGGCGCN